MLKEALAYLFDQANKQAEDQRAHELKFLSSPRKVAFEHNGTIQERDVPPPLRSHFVNSVNDLIAAANRWGEHGVVWIGSGGVHLVIDDDDRREGVTLPLIQSDVFKKAQDLSINATLTQPQMIALLRREFRKSPQAAKLLAAARTLRWNRKESGQSIVQRGSESLGKSVEAAIVGGDEIEQELTLPLSVYSNPGERDQLLTIAFTIDSDVMNQKFIVKPLPDELRIATESAMSSIRDRLMAGVPKGVTVLYGTP